MASLLAGGLAPTRVRRLWLLGKPLDIGLAIPWGNPGVELDLDVAEDDGTLKRGGCASEDARFRHAMWLAISN